MTYHRSVRPHRTGFTLVEMLVVISLVLLIMSIMAEVFRLSSATLTQLRATSDLNQRLRSVESILRGDLESRTIRQVAPVTERTTSYQYGPGADGQPGIAGVDDDGSGTVDDPSELGAAGSDDTRYEFTYLRPVGIDPEQDLGYFELVEDSCADEQGDDGDDILALTIRFPSGRGGFVGGLPAGYYGRVVVGSEPDAAFPPNNDGIGGSLEAEVVYFLRGDTLYRRLLLVGVPQPKTAPAGSWYASYDISARPPTDPDGIPLVNRLGDLTYRSTRFGHCAPRDYYGLDNTPYSADDFGLIADRPSDLFFPFGPFNSAALMTYLLTHSDSVSTNGQHDTVDHNGDVADSLGNRRSGGGTAYPVGGSTPPLGEKWWARATLRETSAPTWDYPTAFNPSSNQPWSPAVRGALSAGNGPRAFDATATRPAEDVLLTGVRSFDIKVYDPDGGGALGGVAGGIGAGAYVDLGYALEDIFANAPGSGPFGASGPPPGPYPSRGSIGGTNNLNDDLLLPTPFPLGFVGTPAQYTTETTWPPQRGTPRGFGTPWLGFAGNSTFYPGMAPAPSALWRTYDTWCTAYTKIDYRTSPSGPVAPPYVVPLRGIQIKIRVSEPETGQTRELTLVQELL